MSKDKLRNLHLDLAQQRGLEKTYCPSEVAKLYNPDNWREEMDTVRKVADELVKENKLVVMQEGEEIEELPSIAKGPIRLRRT